MKRQQRIIETSWARGYARVLYELKVPAEDIEETRNPRQIIRSAVTPASISAASASNKVKICPGRMSDSSVPISMIAAAQPRL